jgi:membrane protein YqaA with SNARE-associated domain
VTDGLIESLGIYGGALIVSFLAGLFPIVGIEVFLLTVATLYVTSWGELAVLVLLASIGHQVAKTSCYFAGAGVLALPRGKLKQQIDAVKTRLERWNKHPMLVLWLSSTIGLPPLYVVSFIAGPIMKIRFVRFTAVCFTGRVLRFAGTTAIPLILA